VVPRYSLRVAMYFFLVNEVPAGLLHDRAIRGQLQELLATDELRRCSWGGADARLGGAAALLVARGDREGRRIANRRPSRMRESACRWCRFTGHRTRSSSR
jgi:hypothetical protein